MNQTKIPNHDPVYKELLSRYFQKNTAIMADYSSKLVNPVGTGIFLNYRGKFYVVTAFHVIEKIIKLGRPKIFSHYLYEKYGFQLKNSLFEFKNPIYLDKENGYEIDLTAVEMDDIPIEDANEIYLNEPNLYLGEPKTEHEHLVVGFPSDIIKMKKVNGNTETWLKVFVFFTGISNKKNWPQQYTDRISLVLDYPKEIHGSDGMQESGIKVMPSPNLRGMSRCGIWMANKSESKIWNANDRLKLIGIQHEWNKNREILVGSKINLILKAIDEKNAG